MKDTAVISSNFFLKIMFCDYFLSDSLSSLLNLIVQTIELDRKADVV